MKRHRLKCSLLAVASAAALGASARPAAAFELKPSARLHLDYGHNSPDVKVLDDGLYIRRAVLGLEGTFASNWAFEIGYNLASKGELKPADGGFRDLTVSYDGWRGGELTLGQFKLPFGLDELTSSNNIAFIERSMATDAFAPSRRMGVGFKRHGAGYTIGAMLFGSSIDGDDRGRGVAARFTAAPIQNEQTVLHFGLAAVLEKPRGKVDFDTAPESRVVDADLVNTGRIDGVERTRRTGLETAWQHGPVTLQGEWMDTTLQRDAGRPNARLDGWHVGASWLLTGETRRYKNGEFKALRPQAASGAWELVARWSQLDLDHGDILGGREKNLTLGLNYYRNSHLRIMLNHIRVHSERRGQSDNPDILLLRLQLVY